MSGCSAEEYPATPVLTHDPCVLPANRLTRCEALRVEVDAQKKSVAGAEEKLREQQAKGGAGAPAAEAKVAAEKDKESSEWRGRGG